MTADQLSALIKDAIDAAGRAYAPYSHYHVGATLRTPAGIVYSGCNIENAAYPATVCAERVALVKAVSEGERAFDTLVVATHNGGSPCGLCRQMLYEFAPNLRVITVDFEGSIHWDGTLSDLLLHGFGPTDLEI
ncbi:MAG: cytidine deaminase [Anaerolineae bacterium]|nr:cytidine deaminase [Anaerolineae bacterium]